MRIPDPTSGEIEIHGRRWLWYTVGHYRGGESDEESGGSWWVTFRDPDDLARHHVRSLTEEAARNPTPWTLRKLFAERAHEGEP